MLTAAKDERDIAVAVLVCMSGITKGRGNQAECEVLPRPAESPNPLGGRCAINGFSGWRCVVRRIRASRGQTKTGAGVADAGPCLYRAYRNGIT